MKAKVTRGSDFRGLLNYLLDPRKGAEIIGGNTWGIDAADLARQFADIAALRPDIRKPVHHVSLSAVPGEHLTREQWAEAWHIHDRAQGIPDDGRPYVIIIHRNTDHEHTHRVLPRIGVDGSVWYGQHDARKAIAATAEIETSLDLIRTAGMRADRKRPKRGEREIAAKRGETLTTRERLQNLIDQAIIGKASQQEFVARLEQQGVTVQFNQASTGRISGISFALDEVAFKGSQLGKKYSYAALLKRGLQPHETAPVPEREREREIDVAASTAAAVVQEKAEEVILAEPVEPEQVLDVEERESEQPEPKPEPIKPQPPESVQTPPAAVVPIPTLQAPQEQEIDAAQPEPPKKRRYRSMTDLIDPEARAARRAARQEEPRKPETLVERERRLMARVRDEKVEIDANEQTRGQNERVQRDEGRPGGQSAVAEQSAETVGDDARAAGRDSGADGRRDAGAFEAHEQRSGVPGGAGEKGVLTPSPTKAQVEPEREPEIDAAAPAAQVEVQPDDPVQQAQKRADGALCRQLEAMGRQAWATSWNERNPHYQASPPALRKVIQDLVQHHPTDQSQILRNMVADRRQVSTLCGVIASYARIAEDMRIASLGDPAAVRDAHRALIEARQQQPKEQREVVRGDGWGRE